MNKKNFGLFWLFFFIILAQNHCAYSLEFSQMDDYLGRKRENKTISMDFSNAELNKVLKIFSQQSGLNFIASADVSEMTLNLYLDKVPVEEALERILSANNLTYELKPESNIFVVKQLKTADSQLITRVYPLKNIAVPSSSLNNTFGSSSSKENTSTTVLSGIMESIKLLLSKDGSVVEDPRTNSLVVTDVPSQFPLIEQTIARLDVRVPQILIEAEMLDISKEAGDHIGVKWAQTPISTRGPTKKYLFPFNKDNAIDDGGIDIGDDEYTAGTLSFEGLAFALEFLKNQTDTKNLARPRILTLNNQKANIQIKTDEAIGLETSTSDVDGSETGSSFERTQTGVFLTVTPQANIETGEIIMAIEPKVSQARSGGTFGEGTSFQQTAKDPEEISTQTVLRVLDGETVVIGGLLRHEKQATNTRVPFMSKIPFLGAAFRHKASTDKEREIIVFITPHIVKEKDLQRKKKSASRGKPLIREQDIPNKKQEEIDKELSYFEKKL